MNSHDAIKTAVAIIWDELPALFAEDWPEVEEALLRLLRELDSASAGDDAAANRIIEIVGKRPEARKRLVSAMAQIVGRQVKGGGAGLFVKRERFTVVPVYYATDRESTGDPDPRRYYSGARGPLTFGVAEVTIPDDHRMGELKKPRWWRLEFRTDPEKHVHLLRIELLDRAEFVQRARSLMETLARPEVLVFVHGYNVSFADAVSRAAQIAYDLHFGGIPVLYSWPSAAQKLKYMADETNIRWTQPHYLDFLRMCLSQLGARTVHVIAHSMGSRVVAETLATVELDQPPHGARLREIVLAAPDIDAGTFRNMAAEFARDGRRVTLYASSKDEALQLSGIAHEYPRAGYSREHLVIVSNVDTIDATNVDSSLLGHSYYGNNRSILSDIFYLLLHGHPPQERSGLLRLEKAGLPYWLFSA